MQCSGMERLVTASGSAAISASTTAAARIHHFTGKPRIRPTSTSQCPKRWRHNRGGKPLRKGPAPVQIKRTTSRGGVMAGRAKAQDLVRGGDKHVRPVWPAKAKVRRRCRQQDLAVACAVSFNPAFIDGVKLPVRPQDAHVQMIMGQRSARFSSRPPG